MAEMATRAGLILAVLAIFAPAASPADPPPFRSLIESAVEGPAGKTRPALRELEACARRSSTAASARSSFCRTVCPTMAR